MPIVERNSMQQPLARNIALMNVKRRHRKRGEGNIGEGELNEVVAVLLSLSWEIGVLGVDTTYCMPWNTVMRLMAFSVLTAIDSFTREVGEE